MKTYKAYINGHELELRGDSWKNALERAGHAIRSSTYSPPYHIGYLESGERFKVLNVAKSGWNHPDSVQLVRPLSQFELNEFTLKKSRTKARKKTGER